MIVNYQPSLFDIYDTLSPYMIFLLLQMCFNFEKCFHKTHALWHSLKCLSEHVFAPHCFADEQPCEIVFQGSDPKTDFVVDWFLKYRNTAYIDGPREDWAHVMENVMFWIESVSVERLIKKY